MGIGIMWLKCCLISFFVLCVGMTAKSDQTEQEAFQNEQQQKEQLQVIRENFFSDKPIKEEVMNFSMVYVTQWAYYLTFQKETIKKYGSFENWKKNPFKPHFDKDNFDYNLTKHSITGNYYYLFYRTRGYNKQQAFMWSVASSLAFEFTVETVTEPPSYQDMYQTPVFGTILGVGSEKLSQYLLSHEAWYSQTLGYILNPFLLLPQTSDFFSSTSYYNKQFTVQLGWRF